MGHENFKSKVEKSKVIKVTLAGYKLAGGFYFSNPSKPPAAMAPASHKFHLCAVFYQWAIVHSTVYQLQKLVTYTAKLVKIKKALFQKMH